MSLKLTNETSYSCQQLPLVDQNGANILRIVLKASFHIGSDGQIYPADDQPDIVMEDQYWGTPGNSCVRFESDVVLEKPFTDIIINGHAYAPPGQAVRNMDLYFHYGTRIRKHLRVYGNRKWDKGLFGWHFTTPEPFIKMPVIYDLAYGGSDQKGSEARNRSGTGYSSKVNNKLKGTNVPNVEFPNMLIKSPEDKPVPAGLGVISRHWEPRLSFAGTYDNEWLNDRFPLLPKDFDMRFNQCVTSDQWVNRPLGREEIRIAGMTPDGLLKFELPDCTMNITVIYKNHSDKKPMDLDTLLIEPDTRKITLTWRATADIHGDPFHLLETIVGSASIAAKTGCGNKR